MSVEEHTETPEGPHGVAGPIEVPKIKAMIVDANGLIKVCNGTNMQGESGSPLMGVTLLAQALRLDTMADKLYTLREVVGEVRDKAARCDMVGICNLPVAQLSRMREHCGPDYIPLLCKGVPSRVFKFTCCRNQRDACISAI